jgi:hypothetical protein
MTVVGDARVLPEDIAQSAVRLRPVFDRIAKASGVPGAEGES